MKEGLDILEKLKAISEQEKENQRNQAVNYIQELTKILAEPTLKIQGKGKEGDYIIWIRIQNKKDKRYVCSNMYFRYKKHSIDNETECSGFYIAWDGNPWQGQELKNVKKEEFWHRVKHIINWANNCFIVIRSAKNI